MRRIFRYIPHSILISGVCILLLNLVSKTPISNEDVLRGNVREVTRETETVFEQRPYIQQELLVELPNTKQITVSSNFIHMNSPAKYGTGDEVLIGRLKNPAIEDTYYLIGYDRSDLLMGLFLTFVVLVILVSKKKGIKSLVGMGYTFLVIFSLILPLLIEQFHPLIISILGMLLIIPVTFLFTHGYNRKTVAAMIGTIVTISVTGLLAYGVIVTSKLTGITSEEIETLFFTSDGSYNLGGLLIAGILIGALGVLDDVTISQASVVSELVKTSKTLSPKDLFAKAMNVGRDHISSVINTLILVYAGASLSSLLLFLTFPRPLLALINDETVVIQIVVALVGSIGLILAVPVTTFVAVKMISGKKP